MKIYGELTPREQEVLTQIRTGATVDEVATRLAIAPSTVKTHLTAIRQKTSARTKIDLMLPELDAQGFDSDAYGFSSRQNQVLALLLEGRSNREIARELWLSPETIKDHLSNIYARLNVRSRYEAAAQVRLDLAASV
jgi:DNA-binding NarL/FixJ family response regulator